MKQGTQGRGTGTALGDGMGRQVGAGFRMGDTCTLVAGLCWCVAETITVLWSNWPPIKINKLKKIQLDLKKKKERKKKSCPRMRVEGESILSLGIEYRKNTGFEIFHNSLKVTWTEEFGFCLFSD